MRADVFADEGLNIAWFVGVWKTEGEFEQVGYGAVEEHLRGSRRSVVVLKSRLETDAQAVKRLG